MKLEIISYPCLLDSANRQAGEQIKNAFFRDGIIGVSEVPYFVEKSTAYLKAAREFSALPDAVKRQYAPKRASGDTEGYELGAEQFKDQDGNWQIDDKKASYYAFVPDRECNKWPRELDLRAPYQALGELIFKTGKEVLKFIGMDEGLGLHPDNLFGYGRMLHYHKEQETTALNPNWCGAHFDHGVFTGLMPAYYFQEGKEIPEPEEAGLFIWPTQGQQFEKVRVPDHSILLFQMGEFGQLASNDLFRATQHLVRKARGRIERFAFAVFYNGVQNTRIFSKSELTRDSRYQNNMLTDGSILYDAWHQASYARYLAS